MQAREEGTTVESCDILADRDSDSDLSSAPSSPTLTNNGLPSPPLTQRSSNASPSPDTASSTTWSSSREDDGPPAKRRKITSPMSRKTAHVALNKCDAKPVDQQNDKDNERGQQLDRLVKALRKKRKIVVVAGAGISVSAGSESSFLLDTIEMLIQYSTGFSIVYRFVQNIKVATQFEILWESIVRCSSLPRRPLYHFLPRNVTFSPYHLKSRQTNAIPPFIGLISQSREVASPLYTKRRWHRHFSSSTCHTKSIADQRPLAQNNTGAWRSRQYGLHQMQ